MAMTKKNSLKKPAAKKVNKASAVATAAAEPRARATAKKAAKAPAVSPEERHKMIEQAAYFRAEKFGWQVDPHENWVAAEKEVEAILAKKAKK